MFTLMLLPMPFFAIFRLRRRVTPYTIIAADTPIRRRARGEAVR